MSGTLFICGTPIGNLEDITLRCINTLKNVDLIAAEDTRHTLKLLNYYKIKKPITSYYEHNKHTKGHKIIKELINGKNVALVSDAGMPGISDPGGDLIKLCYEENIAITVVPGPTAEVSAVVLSGLGSRSYCFEGFLPNGKKQRNAVLNRLKTEERTIVLYEAPHHLVKTLNDLYQTVGNREISIVKEITKKYENVNKGKIKDMIKNYEENEPKGEFVIVIDGMDLNKIYEEKKASFKNISVEEHMEIYLKQGFNDKEAMKRTAKDRGISKRDIYAYFIEKAGSKENI